MSVPKSSQDATSVVIEPRVRSPACAYNLAYERLMHSPLRLEPNATECVYCIVAEVLASCSALCMGLALVALDSDMRARLKLAAQPLSSHVPQNRRMQETVEEP